MKKLLTLVAAAFLATTAMTAQTMKVYFHPYVMTMPASAVGEITVSENGESITFPSLPASFPVSEIDSIVVDQSEFEDNTLKVNYADGKTTVTAPYTLASAFELKVTNYNHVSVIDCRENPTEEITYELSGETTNGSFYMDGNYKSTLRLNDVTIYNPDSAAINIANGKRIKVELVDGTDNGLVDGENGSQKACFFINGHAEFKGGGTLNLIGNAKHAYASDEYTILGASTGIINVMNAANDGFHIGQYFQQDGGKVSIAETGGDCIDVSCTKDETDENNGQVFINGGSLKMVVKASDVKGLKSEGNMTIMGGNISANVLGDGCKGFSVGGDLLIGQADGATTKIEMDVAGTTYHKDQEDESKCRGIKVKGNYTLSGGTINMNVTGKKAKGISIDGTYTYKGGTTNVVPE